MENQQESKNGSYNGSIVFQQMSPNSLYVMKVYGDNQTKARVYGMRLTIIILVLIIFLVRFTLPETYQIISNDKIFKASGNLECNPSNFSPDDKLQCSPFSGANPTIGLVMHHIGHLNQFSLFYVKTTKSLYNNSSTIINQDVVFQLHELKTNSDQKTKIYQYQRTKTLYSNTFNFFPSFHNYMDQEVKKKSNSSKISFKYFFAYSREVMRHSEDQNYNVVALLKFTNITQLQPFDSIILEAQTINPNFTKFSIVIRAVFAILSLITGFIYFKRYAQLTDSDRIPEIKFVAATSVLVFLFNDPFYSITIISPNPLSTFFSTIVVVTFLIFLLFLWIFFLRRIYHQQGSKTTNLFNIRTMWLLYVVLFFIFVFTMSLFCLYEYFTLNKIPMIMYANIEQLKVVPIIVIVAILIGIHIIYQIVLFVLILKKYCWCRRNKQDKLMFRNVNYLTIYPFFLVIYVCFFIAGAAMTFSYEAVWILYGYSFMNLFVFILQYLYYAPVQKQPHYKEDKASQYIQNGESNFQIKQKDSKKDQQLQRNVQNISNISHQEQN